MGQNGSPWLQLVPIGPIWSNRVQMGQHWSKWVKMDSNGSNESNGFKWVQMGLNESNWVNTCLVSLLLPFVWHRDTFEML